MNPFLTNEDPETEQRVHNHYICRIVEMRYLIHEKSSYCAISVVLYRVQGVFIKGIRNIYSEKVKYIIVRFLMLQF
jgi:hypothetical protein